MGLLLWATHVYSLYSDISMDCNVIAETGYNRKGISWLVKNKRLKSPSNIVLSSHKRIVVVTTP